MSQSCCEQTIPQDSNTNSCYFFDFHFHGVISATAARTVTLARTSADEDAKALNVTF